MIDTLVRTKKYFKTETPLMVTKSRMMLIHYLKTCKGKKPKEIAANLMIDYNSVKYALVVVKAKIRHDIEYRIEYHSYKCYLDRIPQTPISQDINLFKAKHMFLRCSIAETHGIKF